MHYIKYLSMALLLLAIPAALLASGGATTSAPSTAADKSYWETITAFPGNNKMTAAAIAVTATALAVYVAHNHSEWARKNATGPALEKFAEYWRNIVDGKVNAVTHTGTAVLGLTGGVLGVVVYGVYTELFGRLPITIPAALATT